jgi:hypothetical protein
MTENDEWEHSALFYVVDALDHICEKLGLVKLSSFLDWTDFEINIAMQEIARTNQNPKDEWRGGAPPHKNLGYIAICLKIQKMKNSLMRIHCEIKYHDLHVQQFCLIPNGNKRPETLER